MSTWCISALAASLAIGGTLNSASAALITFELRTTSGQTTVMAKPGGTVNVTLYAIIANTSSSADDDGISLMHGSFRSTTTGLKMDVVSNAPAGSFNSVPAQSGALQDIDGDGDMDAGSLLTTSPAIPPWFIGSSGLNPITGVGPSGNPTEILVGTASLRIGSATGTGQFYFEPRIKMDGPINSRKIIQFRSDGIDYQLAGDDPDVAISPLTVSVPEPTHLSLVVFSAAAIILRRRRKSSR